MNHIKRQQRRWVSLLGSVIIALSAGSTYVFSSYAPQLQEALHLSSTQLNILGLAGNLGMYMSGPVWGRWIDQAGPYGAVISGAFLVLTGYGMLSRAHKYAWTDMPVLMLSFFCLCTGLGNSAGNNAAINVQAKSWGEDHRGSAMALVLSAFGLSAFVYSTLSHTFFTGNVTGYLDMLALGSFSCFIVGMMLIKIVPPSEGEQAQQTASSSQYERVPDREDPERDATPGRKPLRRMRSSSETSARVIAWIRDVHESEYGHADDDQVIDERDPGTSGITGLQLVRNVDFLLLFTILGFLSGSGLLLINNVGTITRALWDHAELENRLVVGKTTATWLESLTGVGAEFVKKAGKKQAVQRVQAFQVSCISVGNALGRILIGLVSDYLVYVTQRASYRTLLLIPIVLLAIASQSLAAWPGVITTVHRLLFVSAMTGLMYGFLFGLGPVLVFEWFGVSSFSENWGWMSFAPVIFGNVYNIMFGRYVTLACARMRGREIRAPSSSGN